MMKIILSFFRGLFFGNPVKGEKANYVNNDIQPKLKKWQQ